jgi:hypothetical protein
MNKLLPVISAYFLVLLFSDLKAQEREWEFDKIQRREKQRKQELDSTLVHLKDRWEIKLAYGRWHFSKNSKSDMEELFTFPESINSWQLMGSWHFDENLSANLFIDFQLFKNLPTPNFFDIVNGKNIEIQGSGGFFLPIDLGLKYYIRKQRFRPLVGFGIGSVSANFRYTLAEGNINNGIERTDKQMSSRAIFGKIFTGFDYRLRQGANFSMNFLYHSSRKFESPIGGYLRFQGLVINTGLAIII